MICRGVFTAVSRSSRPTAHGRLLQKRDAKIQDHLFLFLEDGTMPPTNNSSEHAIRMSTDFRKVTNGFRSDRGCYLFAAVRSMMNTGNRHGLPAFQAGYARRAGIEGTISRGTRSTRLRRTRYIGLPRVHLGHILTAVGLECAASR